MHLHVHVYRNAVRTKHEADDVECITMVAGMCCTTQFIQTLDTHHGDIYLRYELVEKSVSPRKISSAPRPFPLSDGRSGDGTSGLRDSGCTTHCVHIC